MLTDELFTYLFDGQPRISVTLTTSLEFMVEVTRLRADQKSTRAEAEGQTAAASASLATPLFGERLADTIGSKLGQLLPQRSNLLLVGVEAARLTHEEFHASMLRIQQRAEGNDPAVVQRHGFRDRADFFQHYQRLSGILVRGGSPLQAAEPVILWGNPQSKYPLPAKMRTAFSPSHIL